MSGFSDELKRTDTHELNLSIKLNYFTYDWLQ